MSEEIRKFVRKQINTRPPEWMAPSYSITDHVQRFVLRMFEMEDQGNYELAAIIREEIDAFINAFLPEEDRITISDIIKRK